MGLFDFLQVRNLFGLDTPYHKVKDPIGDDPLFASAAWKYYDQKMRRAKDRMSKYRDYERMDEYELIASALDLYAEDCCQLDAEHSKTIWVESANADVMRVAHAMFERVSMEEKISSITRKMCKYGDNFVALSWDTESGNILHLQSPYPAQISRVQEKGQLLGFNPGPDGERLDKSGTVKWKPWEIIHFRMPARDGDDLYGDSILYPAASAWEQLKMSEDAMVVYRLQRAPDRLIYYIDVGTATAEEAYDIVNRWRKAIKKREHLDTQGQDYRNQWNPQAADADLFWPIREGSQSRVDKLPGSTNIGEIADVEYLRNKMFGALRIPKAFMGFDDAAGGSLSGDAPLTTQSVRFASTIKGIRKSLLTGIRRLLAIQMVYKRLDPHDEKNSFTVNMAPISYLDDLMRSKIYALRTQMTNDAMNMGINLEFINKEKWVAWALRRFFRLSENEIEQFIDALPADVQGPSQVGPDADKLVQLVASDPRKLGNLVEAYVAHKVSSEMDGTEQTAHYPDNFEANPLPPMEDSTL